jgi:transcriptional regulator with XRE-family HTH domain
MNDKALKYFGARVRLIRLKRGLSQEDLADQAGLHRTYIGMIERAEKNVTLRNIDKLCRALGVTISEIFDGYKH